jgi:hypothetical protein
MAISDEILYAEIGDLYLDPLNPRLGRAHSATDLSQEKILDLMRDWTLDELAVSFLESGYWPQEALICVSESASGGHRLTVVEGNRRLAALKYLKRAFDGKPASRRWATLIEGVETPTNLFNRVPYILAESRDDVDAFLGFRHVTGIKEWKPAEKAEYIAKLVDQRGMTYREVTRAIGSKIDTVRRNYIAYRLLRQLEEVDDADISLDRVESRFSVLYLSLREPGIQEFLGLNVRAEPKDAERPVAPGKIENLAWFTRWLFGSDTHDPLFTDSRDVTKFGRTLQSERAVDYLKASRNPSFELAIQKSGADEPELVELIETATDSVEQALGRIHLHRDSRELAEKIDRFGKSALEVLRRFNEKKYLALIRGDCNDTDSE